MTIKLVIKGSAAEAADALLAHGIQRAKRFVAAEKLTNTVLTDVDDTYTERVQRWFGEHGGPPFAHGTLLWYRHTDREAL